MAKISTDAVINWIRVKLQGSAPASPAANYGYIYEKSDKKLYFKNEDGTETDLTAGAGVTQYTDEMAQDAIGAMIADTDTLDITYTDATPELKADVKKQMSITSDSSGIKLSGDSSSPGNNKVYGTDGSGTKGWKADPAGGGSSVLVQRVISEVGSSATGTTTMPLDDTIPQNTEGDQYMTVSITPTNASNILFIEVILFAVHSTGAWISAALFQDSVANALAAMTSYSTTAGGGAPIVFRHKMVAGGTSAIAFKVRAGNHLGAGTVTFNGNAGSRIFGGVIASSITVTELTP